jgi:PRTRC genetic system protein C
MESHILHRYFEVHGVKLPDPNPALSVEEIRGLYSQQYPEIAAAAVTGPEQVGDKLVYRFSTAIGTKG